MKVFSKIVIPNLYVNILFLLFYQDIIFTFAYNLNQTLAKELNGTNQQIHVIILKVSALPCDQNGLCLEVRLLSQVKQVSISQKCCLYQLTPPAVYPGILNFEVTLRLIHTYITFKIPFFNDSARSV